MARPFRNPARNPTSLALSSAELPAGYSSKNSKNNNDGRKEKAGASAILCDHDGAGFPRKTGDRSHLEDMALFRSSSLPIVSRAPSFSLSPASRRHKEASARVEERTFLGYTQHRWSPRYNIIE